MSQGQAAAAGFAERAASGGRRVARAFRALPHERRLAAYAAIGLFVSMFLPWYQRQFFTVVANRLLPASDSQTAWAAFSFVEAAVLLIAAGVLTLLFQRAEGRAFHLPGGDGWVIMIAGFWTCVLVIWRIFDREGGSAHGQNATTYGIKWGIFIALALGALLAYAGSRIRLAHQPEPPLPGEKDQPRAPAGAPAEPHSGSSAGAPTEPPESDTRSHDELTVPLEPRRRERER